MIFDWRFIFALNIPTSEWCRNDFKMKKKEYVCGYIQWLNGKCYKTNGIFVSYYIEHFFLLLLFFIFVLVSSFRLIFHFDQTNKWSPHTYLHMERVCDRPILIWCQSMMTSNKAKTRSFIIILLINHKNAIISAWRQHTVRYETIVNGK